MIRTTFCGCMTYDDQEDPVRVGIDKAAQFGFDGVDLHGVPPEEKATAGHKRLDPDALDEAARRKLKEYIAGKGLFLGYRSLIRLHVVEPEARERQIEHGLKDIDLAADLGAQYIAFWRTYLATEEVPADEWERMYEASLETLRQLLPRAEARGIRMLIENHEQCIWATARTVRRILDHFDSQVMGAVLDFGNLYFEGIETSDEAIELLWPYLVVAEAEQAKKRPVTPADKGQGKYGYKGYIIQRTLIAEGDINYWGIIGKLKRMGFDGFLYDEYHSRRVVPERPHPDVGLPADLAFLRKALAEA